MNAGQVRAVSYGEDMNRLVVPGGVKEAGMPNRRVALVTDFGGTGHWHGDGRAHVDHAGGAAGIGRHARGRPVDSAGATDGAAT